MVLVKTELLLDLYLPLQLAKALKKFDRTDAGPRVLVNNLFSYQSTVMVL